MSPTALGATCVVVATEAARDCMPEALTVSEVARKRPSRANCVRSGGTSRGAVLAAWLR